MNATRTNLMAAALVGVLAFEENTKGSLEVGKLVETIKEGRGIHRAPIR